MLGFTRLSNLNNTIKDKIKMEYGSIENLYKQVFELYTKDFKLHMTSPKDNKQINVIKGEIYKIDEKLEEFGIQDGSEITLEIGNDHNEIVLNNEITKLDNLLKAHGSDYPTMREWIKKNHGI